MIYYEYGALVLLFNNVEIATKTFNILREGNSYDKALLVLLLPNIQVTVQLNFLLICGKIQKAYGIALPEK